MKKFIVLVLIMISVLGGIFADGKVYLQPMRGSGGIPLNPKRDPNNSHYTEIKGYIDADGGTLARKPFKGESSTSLKAGEYTLQETIGLGGIQGMTNDADSTRIELSATCDNGFFLVSQSNPSYKRPFELYVIPRANAINERIIKDDVYEKYGKERVLSDSSPKISFEYAKLTNDRYDKQNLWFDLVLVLPGTVEGNTLITDKGEYVLMKSDDYSATVNLAMQVYQNGQPYGSALSLTIPFSGYFSDVQGDVKDSSVSMYIYPTAAAGNLNMKSYTRQKIADIKVSAVVELGIIENIADPDTWWGQALEILLGDLFAKAPAKAFGLFVSSSPDPYDKQAKEFLLEKENLPYGSQTEYNSVGYKVVLVDSKTKVEKVYLGNNHITGSESQTNQPEWLIAPDGKNNKASQTYASNNKSFAYEGEVYVVINNNQGITMEAGRYVSDVYVHVINLI